MAKKQQRKKVRGIQYVSSVIKKYGGKRYAKSSDARQKAKEILSILKQNNDKIQTKTIISLLRKRRSEVEQIPSIPSEMSSVNNYFILTDYPRLIRSETSNKIQFISRVSNSSLPPIKGGSLPDYNTYFKPFVDYCNDLAALTDEDLISINALLR